MQIKLDIPDNKIAKRILSVLEQFKKDGVVIRRQETDLPKQEKNKYTDEYVKKHWRKFVYAASGNPLQDDDEVLMEEYGKFLNEKHNI